MAYIRVKTGPHKGKTYEISDAPITVGREETQTIQILDQGVSRAHAEIFRLGEMCFVRDLNSTNGTYVNDIKVLEESLKAGDELLIGTTILTFEEVLPGARNAAGDGVVFEADEGTLKPPSTVELKVDDRGAGPAKAVGQEVTSRNITLISQVGRILRTDSDLQSSVEKTLEIVSLAVGANQGFLFVVDPDGKVVPKAVAEMDDSGADKKVSRTIVSRVRGTGMPLLTTDATLDGRFALSESIILKKIRSVICAPIFVEDRVDGLLYFHSNKVDHSLTVEDLELVTSVALQLTMATSLAAASERIRKGLMGTIRALVAAMEIADPLDRGHAQRTADYAAAIAQQMGLPPDEIHRVRLAAMLHDVGKLALHHAAGAAVPTAGADHVAAGERILSGIEGFEQIIPGVRYHHERADGTGPFKIKNADLPVMARIVIVANSFDNGCIRGGPDGKGLPAKEVVKDMAKRGGTEFDDDVLRALIVAHRNDSLFSSAGPGAP